MQPQNFILSENLLKIRPRYRNSSEMEDFSYTNIKSGLVQFLLQDLKLDYQILAELDIHKFQNDVLDRFQHLSFEIYKIEFDISDHCLREIAPFLDTKQVTVQVILKTSRGALINECKFDTDIKNDDFIKSYLD